MVEIFKTNVSDQANAKFLIESLGRTFPGYKINFDLEDCDKILRIQSFDEEICVEKIISFLKQHECTSELFQDDMSLFLNMKT